MSPTWHTPPTIARMLGCKPERVIGWIRAGALAAVNLSDGASRPRFRIAPSALEVFLASRRVQPPVRTARRRRQAAEVIIEFF